MALGGVGVVQRKVCAATKVSKKCVVEVRGGTGGVNCGRVRYLWI